MLSNQHQTNSIVSLEKHAIGSHQALAKTQLSTGSQEHVLQQMGDACIAGGCARAQAAVKSKEVCALPALVRSLLMFSPHLNQCLHIQ